MSGRAAVVIGINYVNFPANTPAEVQTRSGLNPLRYAEADAQDMGALLQQAGYDVALLMGLAATRRTIIETIGKQRQVVGQDGLLVVHFAGHGDVDTDNIAYLLPADADPNELAATAIPLDDLATRYFGSLGSAVTMIDCCHSGYAVGLRTLGEDEARGRAGVFLSRASSSFANVRGRVVLAACAGDQLARELPQFQHGAFTYYALQQWRNNPEEVDVELLFRGIDQGLQSLGLPRPVKGGVQEGRIILRETNPHYLEQRRRLYSTINPLDNEDLDNLLFSLGLDYHALAGESRSAKIRSLIISAERTNRLDDLERAVHQQLEAKVQEHAVREAAEGAARTAAERMTREKANQEDAARLAREQAAQEEVARLARKQAAQTEAARIAVETAAPAAEAPAPAIAALASDIRSAQLPQEAAGDKAPGQSPISAMAQRVILRLRAAPLWLQWLIVNMAAWLLPSQIAGQAYNASYNALQSDSASISARVLLLFGGLVIGSIVGVGQWLLLRQSVPKSALWIGIIAAIPAFISLSFLFSDSSSMVSVVIILSTIIAGSAGQWWFMRKHSKKSLWGLLAGILNCLALASAIIIGVLLIPSLSSYTASSLLSIVLILGVIANVLTSVFFYLALRSTPR